MNKRIHKSKLEAKRICAICGDEKSGKHFSAEKCKKYEDYFYVSSFCNSCEADKRRLRYETDPVYRKKMQEKSRQWMKKKYTTDSAFRKKSNKRCVAYQKKNRETINYYNREKYRADPIYKQKVIARALKRYYDKKNKK